jgi:hypothetical protein
VVCISTFEIDIKSSFEKLSDIKTCTVFPLAILAHPLTRNTWKYGSQRVQENLVKPISLHSVPDLPIKP